MLDLLSTLSSPRLIWFFFLEKNDNASFIGFEDLHTGHWKIASCVCAAGGCLVPTLFRMLLLSAGNKRPLLKIVLKKLPL